VPHSRFQECARAGPYTLLWYLPLSQASIATTFRARNNTTNPYRQARPCKAGNGALCMCWAGDDVLCASRAGDARSMYPTGDWAALYMPYRGRPICIAVPAGTLHVPVN